MSPSSKTTHSPKLGMSSESGGSPKLKMSGPLNNQTVYHFLKSEGRFQNSFLQPTEKYSPSIL